MTSLPLVQRLPTLLPKAIAWAQGGAIRPACGAELSG